jgi:hypothetical protein
LSIFDKKSGMVHHHTALFLLILFKNFKSY